MEFNLVSNTMIKILTLFCIIQCDLISSNKVTYEDSSQAMSDLKDKRYCSHPDCPKAAHIVCQDINGLIKKCSGKKVTFTEDYIDFTLKEFNKLRSLAATGQVTGYAGRRLPKASGMVKVLWDSKLAAFAQLWASSCPDSNDICRATDQFTNPGQLILSAPVDIKTYEELTPTKIRGAIKNSLNYVFRKDSKYVSEEMIERTPDWNNILSVKRDLYDTYHGGQYYINIVHSEVTHIGCGFTAAHVSDYTTKNENKFYFICNLSHQPKRGSPVYRTRQILSFIPDKPTKKFNKTESTPLIPKKKKPLIMKKICTSKANCVALDFTDDDDKDTHQEVRINKQPEKEDCGCPEGFTQTEDCLCEQPRNSLGDGYVYHLPPEPHDEEEDDDSGNPVNIVLPMIADDSVKAKHELEDIFFAHEDGSDQSRQYQSRNRPLPGDTTPVIDEDEPRNSLDWESKRKMKLEKYNTRQSLFAKAPKFQLHGHSKPGKTREIKKYEPELNFNNEMVYSDEHIDNINRKNYIQNDIISSIRFKNENVQDDEPIEDTIIQRDIEDNIYSNEKSPSNNKDSLVVLLDNIEKAIRYTPLDPTKKGIIHSKIKKIYSLVGLSKDSSILQHSDDAQKFNNVDNLNKNTNDMIIESDDAVYEDHARERHRRKQSKEKLISIKGKRITPFDFDTTNINKDDLTLENEMTDEVNMPNSYENYRFYSHEKLKPKLQYKNKIHNERRKDLEALMEIVDKKYQKRKTRFNNKPNYEYRSGNDETNLAEDKKYRSKQREYDGDKNIDYSFEEKSRYLTADDERMTTHAKYDIESSDGEDLPDNEWTDFYKDNLKKYNTAHFRNGLRRNVPVNMHRRLKDLGLSLDRPRLERYYEPDRTRFEEGYY